MKLSLLFPFSGDDPNKGNALRKREGVQYFFWARSAIYHGLSALRMERGKEVLVPAFHCKSLVDPILLFGGKTRYYNVGRDCSVDRGDLVSKIGGNTGAIVIVHYFGFPQEMETLRESCREKGILLVEDCAHVLPFAGSDPDLGRSGDFSVFSIRKFFPMCDGGALVLNRPAPPPNVRCRKDPFFAMKETRRFLGRLAHDSGWTFLEKPYKRLASLRGKDGNVSPGERGGPVPESGDLHSMELGKDNVDLGMSIWSRRVFDNADVASIVAKRRYNYGYFANALSGCGRLKMFFPEMKEGICPLVFPFSADGRKDFHLELRERGIPATTWGGVVHPGFPIRDFPDAKYLYDNLIMLPVHQDLAADDLEFVCETILESVKKYHSVCRNIQ